MVQDAVNEMVEILKCIGELQNIVEVGVAVGKAAGKDGGDAGGDAGDDEEREAGDVGSIANVR